MDHVCLAPRIRSIVISLPSCLSKFCHQVYTNKSGSLSWGQGNDDKKKAEQMKVAERVTYSKKPQQISQIHSKEDQTANINLIYQKYS